MTNGVSWISSGVNENLLLAQCISCFEIVPVEGDYVLKWEKKMSSRVSPKFGAGFNIDALGFSFGGKQTGSYINGNMGQTVKAKPTSFNILLVGNNDQGSLNSEFYLRYFFKEYKF